MQISRIALRLVLSSADTTSTVMSSSSLPIWAVILDLFGTLLIAGGIFVVVAEGELLGRPAIELRGLAIRNNFV